MLKPEIIQLKREVFEVGRVRNLTVLEIINSAYEYDCYIEHLLYTHIYVRDQYLRYSQQLETFNELLP